MTHEERQEWYCNWINGNKDACREVLSDCSKLDIVNLISGCSSSDYQIKKHNVIATMKLYFESIERNN